MFAKLRSKMTTTKCDKHSPQDDYRTPIGEMPDNDTADNYAYIDDEILVLDWTASKTESTFYVIGLTIGLVFLTWLLLPFLDSDKLIIPIHEFIDIIAVFLIIITVLASFAVWIIMLYYIAFHIYRAKRKITFHRLTGMVEVPKPLFWGWNGATIMFPFTDQRVKYLYHGASIYYISYPGHKGAILLTAGRIEIRKEYAFILWYMDRNRQLPPGKRLNPYRVKDFLRREAEGFPKPLRYASIKIPSRKKVPSALKREREKIVNN